MEKEWDTRYYVEQYLLPQELYSSGPMLITKMIGDPVPALRELFIRGKAEDLPQPELYREDHRVFYKDDESILVIRIKMPAPTAVARSRAVYLCYSDRSGDNLYLMSELNSQGQFFLCCKPDPEYGIMHLLCGDAPAELDEEFDLVAEQYWSLVKDNGLSELADMIKETKAQREKEKVSLAG